MSPRKGADDDSGLPSTASKLSFFTHNRSRCNKAQSMKKYILAKYEYTKVKKERKKKKGFSNSKELFANSNEILGNVETMQG
jgi:hypothetical protein